jgi:hypothetical protein
VRRIRIADQVCVVRLRLDRLSVCGTTMNFVLFSDLHKHSSSFSLPSDALTYASFLSVASSCYENSIEPATFSCYFIDDEKDKCVVNNEDTFTGCITVLTSLLNTNTAKLCTIYDLGKPKPVTALCSSDMRIAVTSPAPRSECGDVLADLERQGRLSSSTRRQLIEHLPLLLQDAEVRAAVMALVGDGEMGGDGDVTRVTAVETDGKEFVLVQQSPHSHTHTHSHPTVRDSGKYKYNYASVIDASSPSSFSPSAAFSSPIPLQSPTRVEQRRAPSYYSAVYTSTK